MTMLEKAPYFISNYQRQEQIFLEISHHIYIDDVQYYVYSDELSDLIVNTVSLIESGAKYLHEYLSICEPNSTKTFNNNEDFDFVALKVLNKRWNLAQKEIYVIAPSIHTSDKYKTITPLNHAEEGANDINAPSWSKAYQAAKHNKLATFDMMPNIEELTSSIQLINNQLISNTKQVQSAVKQLYTITQEPEEALSESELKNNESIFKKISKIADRVLNIAMTVRECFSGKEKPQNQTKQQDDSDTNGYNVITKLQQEFPNTSIREMYLNSLQLSVEAKPTIKAALEALGALFILCLYIQNLPEISKETNKKLLQAPNAPLVNTYAKFDASCNSKLFTTKLVVAYFQTFGPVLSNTCLYEHFNEISNKAIFIAKFPEKYLIELQQLRAKTRWDHRKIILQDTDLVYFLFKKYSKQSNTDSKETVLEQLREVLPHIVYAVYDMLNSLEEFKKQTDNEEKANKLILLEISDNSEKLLTDWSNSNEVQRQLKSMDPDVVLNTYNNNDDIYDYKNLNNAYKLTDEEIIDLMITFNQTLQLFENQRLEDEQ